MKKAFRLGTHRAREPHETLALIDEHVRVAGISRCADITGLDELGLPVYAAIRPASKLVQVANGKGVTALAARVSALMEGIEHHAAENPPPAPRVDSWQSLARGEPGAVDPRTLPGFRHHGYFSESLRLPWMAGEELGSGRPAWVPLSSVFAVEPSLYDWTSNGLASGNNVLEATLHALFELAERHVMSLLVEDGSVDFSACTAIDVAQSGDPVVRGVVERMAHRVGVRLLRVDVDWPIHTMAAVLLDARPFAHCSEVTFGYGAHLSPSVAATRALTEAAQARLALIHGAREDLQPTAYQREHGRVYRLFEGIAPERAWSTLTGHAGDSLDEDYRTLLGCFADAGFPTLYRVVLTPPDAAIAVVRVLMPGALNQFPR